MGFWLCDIARYLCAWVWSFFCLLLFSAFFFSWSFWCQVYGSCCYDQFSVRVGQKIIGRLKYIHTFTGCSSGNYMLGQLWFLYKDTCSKRPEDQWFIPRYSRRSQTAWRSRGWLHPNTTTCCIICPRNINFYLQTPIGHFRQALHASAVIWGCVIFRK